VTATNRLRISVLTLALTLALALAVVALASLANPALAGTTISVSSTADDATTNGNCTLREAIIAANTDAARDACTAGSGADTIIVPAGTYKLTNGIAGENENFALTGDLDITDVDGLRIKGAGARKTVIDGQDIDRIFDIRTGVQADMLDLTITNGSVTGFGGGGGVVVERDSIVGLYRVAVTNNTSTHSCFSCFGGGGGGILNYHGHLTLNYSTVSGNTAHSDDGGGGLLLGPYGENGSQSPQATNIYNSTISGNRTIVTEDGGDPQGGGIHILEGLITIWTSTITNNTAPPFSGSGIASFSDTEVRSTIISQNANNNDVVATGFPTNHFQSFGYNLIGGGNASPAFNQPGDQTGVTDPLLGPLKNNGGSTDTHALLRVSPAINAIPKEPDGCGVVVKKDQREVKRPQGTKCDIGAYEKVRRR